MQDKITKSKLEKYFSVTEKALKISKKSVEKERGEEAEEIIAMVENYLNDAKYFKTEGKYVEAFACLNYAHGWLDSGARLGIFKVKDNKLFVIK
jgi:hypothetical protein